MQVRAALLLAWVVFLGQFACQSAEENVYPYRWFYVSRSLNQDSHVEEIRTLVETAAASGLNGMCLSAGFDAIDLKGDDYLQRLEEVRQICESHEVDLIPRCLDIGYNGGLLAHDRNLAAGIPVRDSLFVVRGGKAAHKADPPVRVANGSFEIFNQTGVRGFSFPGEFGEVVFSDREVVKEGRASLRFEVPKVAEDNPARLFAEVKVQPNRLYRVSIWIKTEDLDPSNPFGSGRMRVNVLGAGERQLTYFNPRLAPTDDWKEVRIGFNSRNYDSVDLQIGVWDGTQGRFWLDNLNIEELGLVNLLRRPGAPLVVQGEKSEIIYEEGTDFERVEDPELNFRFDHDGPEITLTERSRIREGERLRVSFYHGVTVYRGQVTACMSEPKVYEIWRNNVRLIDQYLDNGRYFFSVDEIRAGGTCKACRDRSLTMGEILGESITKGVEIIRAVNSDAEIFIWSDMLDPNHNGGDRKGNYYYHVDQPFTGGWNHVPKDLIIACWYHKMRKESLSHFSGLGFKTFACGYYDKDNLDNDVTWLEALDETPGALGIMYTTWLNKYELMSDFGKLVSSPRPVPIKKLEIKR
jgi:hypothetical protein